MGLPAHLLRDVTLRTRSTTTDAYGDTVAGSWTETTIAARVEQSNASMLTDEGRQASVSRWRLATNSSAVTAHSQIVDGTLTYEVDGRPWPVHRGTTDVHHYEADLVLTEG